MGDWTFFSNHGHVLVCLARDSDARLRDVAVQVGITERAVQKIVRDLQDKGYLEVSKHGRRNRYRINNRKALRHHLQSGCTVGQLLGLLSKQEPSKARAQLQAQPQAKPRAKPEPQAEPESQDTPGKTEEPRPIEKPKPPVGEEKPAPVADSPARPKPSPAGAPASPQSDERRQDDDLEQGRLF